ncbi:MAG: cob(I)yrinic acid a,c-diamide adenosyltransferase [Actinobacteria bacterium]|nr:cob(I)yrinic acid a,c-diamide adenosyltransferase [Actinomycetota bacterium]
MLGKGRVIVNTGDGKGKTTAAFGTAFRAAGHGLEVAVVQFIKGSWDYGELNAARRFPNISVTRIGSGYTWMAKDPNVPQQLAREAWAVCLEKAMSGKYDLLVMDELNYAVKEGYVSVEEILALIRNRPSRLSLIITGRDARPELIAEADTVTEMRRIKHAFAQGIRACKGIEY